MSDLSYAEVARFMFKLRGIGLYTNRLMSRHIEGRHDGDHFQFLITCLVSYDEIYYLDDTIVTEFRDFLDGLGNDINCKHRYIRNGRIAVLLNSERPYHVHGEARLLDPDGGIRQKLGIDVPYDYAEPRYYLSELEYDFGEEFGEEEQSCLLIFSHYIPCTLDEHMCAKIVGKYANRSPHNVYVAYKDVYEGTNENQATRAMQRQGTKVIYPETMEEVANEAGYQYF